MFLDYIIFQKINGLAGQWAWLDALGFFSAEILIFMLGAAPIVYFLAKRSSGSKILLIRAASSASCAWLANQAIGLAYFRFRPFVQQEVTKLIEMSAGQKSFPSDHTAVSFAIAFSVFFCNKKAGSAVVVLAFLVGLSRIFAGVHYPVDVLAGIFVGFLAAFFAKRIIAREEGPDKKPTA